MFKEYSKLLTSTIEIHNGMEKVTSKKTQIVCECESKTVKNNFKVEL